MFILKNNPSLRRMSQIRRNFGATCTLKGIAVRRSLSVRSCFGAWCTNSYTSEKTTSNGEFIRTDTRATKFLAGAHYTQAQGRSMVEMLGVLAIIGVLSVGAIAGYSKAMFKYKLNKHAEQMNTVINAVARNVHNFDNIKQGGTSLTSYFIKMGEIPTEMIKQNQTNLIYDIFGQGWNIFITGDGSQILLSTYSTDGSSSLTAKSANNLDICKNIITAAKENSDSINYMLSVNNHSSANQISSSLNGGTCSSGNKCLKNLKLDDIYYFCTKHYGVNSPTGTEMMISWKR